MNHIYRTIWNHAKRVWQVVGENAKGRGKVKSSCVTSRLLVGTLLVGPSFTVYGQDIVIDGRTGTSLVQQGNTTDIYTTTIQNGNAFNSFSRFNVSAGYIANLHVPGSANALINIVRDQRTTIDGILNSYKNGVIGGDVYFANPHGFVVGAGGVINVGSLTVSTPDAAFLETLLGGSGNINNFAAEQLKAGNFPISESGLIAIRGQVNAAGRLGLTGDEVLVAAGGRIGSGPQALTRIEQMVNTQGLVGGNALASIDGEIHILASGNVSIAGTVAADGIAGRAGGTIDIRAGGDIGVDTGALISASGHGIDSAGGSVTLFADRNASLASGASVAANAGDSGDGGFVEFSAKKQVAWSGSLEARSAGGGAAGHVLIDPEEIDISSDQRLVGTDYTLQADKRITIHDGVMVSTRNIADALTATQAQHRDAVSIGNSGNITLEAPRIELGDGASLYAHTNTPAHTAGDVTLTARSAEGALITPVVLIGVGSNTAEVTLGDNVDIRGKRVSITAEASTALTDSLSEANLYNSYDAEGNPVAEYLSEEDKAAQRQQLVDAGVMTEDDAGAGDPGLFEGLLDTLGSSGLLASVQVLKANAAVNIADNVKIIASDDIQVAAHAVTHAQASVQGLHLGAVVAVTDANAQLNIGQNTRIESTGGNVALKSQSDSKVETAVTAMQVSSKLPVTITANVSHAEGSALTTVGSGTLVKASGDVAIDAEQNKTFDISASAGDSEGAIGVAVVVALSDLDAETRFAGTIDAGQDARVGAVMNTLNNKHAAAVVIGDTLGTRVAKVQDDVTGQTKIQDGIKSVFDKLTQEGENKGGNDESSSFLKEVGLAGAFAYVDHQNAARVVVEENAVLKAGRDATLEAQVTDALNSAVAAEVSDKKNTAKPLDFKGTLSGGSATEKKNGAAVAILISSQDNDAELLVRQGARLDAARNLDLRARAALPWLEQSRIANLIQALGQTGDWDSFTDTVSKGNQLFSTWVDAATTTSGQAAADDGTTLSGMVNVNNVGLDATVTVEDGVQINRHHVPDPAIAQRVNIAAEVESQMVNVAADPVPFSSSGGKNGFGASVIVGTYTHNAEVRVGAVDIDANALDVSADTDVRMINYAMAGSSGGKNAFGGSVAVAILDNTTRAGIDDGSNLNVSAFTGSETLQGDINISASDNVDSLTVTGGVVRSTTRAFGVAAGANDFTRVTEAWLGDTATAKANGRTEADGAVRVRALSDGMIGNYAISAAVTADNVPDPKAPEKASAGNKEAGDFGLNVSGSAAVNLVNNTVSAAIRDDLDITAGALSVEASEDTAMHAIAGGAAVSTTTGNGAGLAGAYTHNTFNAEIAALLEANGTVRSDSLAVVADNEASILSIAAGVSASLKSNSSYQLAGSVTFNTIDAQTTARLANGDIGVTGDARIEADDNSVIKAVAGSASYGGKAGVGAGISINDIASATTAEVADVAALGAQNIHVDASNNASLVSVAAAMGYSAQYAFDGAVAVNRIDNTTRAAITDASNLDAAQDLVVSAGNSAGIVTVSGTVAASGGNALGASFAYNEIKDSVTAEMIDSDAEAGNARLSATQNVSIDALVAGGAAGKSNAATGSVAVNTIDNNATARSIGSDLRADGDVVLTASDDSRIRVLTGALAYGGSGAGIGIAGSYNEIGGQVYAGASGGNLSASGGSVLLTARRDQQLQSLAAGAGGGNTGVAGSVAVNHIGGSTTAEIVGGAEVLADDNVLVSATSDSDIETIAGALGIGQGGVGLGGAVAVNELHGTTTARIGGTATRVTASGRGNALNIDNGEINGDESADLRDRRLSETIRGTAVIASSTDEINTVAASIGGSAGSVGAAGAVTVNNVGGTTLAEIADGATINANAGRVADGAAASQAVQVGAYHHTRVEHATGAAGIGGSAGIGLSVGTTLVSHDTIARVADADIASAASIGVDARASSDLNGVVVGAGGGAGSAGGAGSVAVTTIAGSVQADIVDSTLRSDDGNLDLTAGSTNAGHMIAGALAGGSAAGIGATVIVSSISQETLARTTGSSLDAAGTTRIAADAEQTFLHVGATAAGGGSAGVAGTVSVLTAEGRTLASAGTSTTINAVESGSDQDVIISASDRIDTSAVLGTLGVGGTAGIGASADIQNIRSGAIAEIGSGSSINADRDIKVTAQNERDVDSKAIAAGGGGFVGAAAGVSVVSVAAGASGTATDSLEGSLASAQTTARNSGLNGQMGDQYAGADNLQSGIQARQATVSPNDSYTSAADAGAYSAAAMVAGGSTLNAGRDIDIGASNKTDAANQGVGAAAGLVGAGAGVAVIDVGDRSLASLGGTATAGRNVRISAEDGQDGLTRAEAQAGGGGAVGIGAAVAVSDKRSTTTARLLDGAQLTAAGSIEISAGLDHALESETIGVAVGGVAVGASIASASTSGEAQALVGQNARVQGASVDVNAVARSSNEVLAVGASGGALAASAVVGTADDSTLARAWIADDASVSASNGQIALRAATDPFAKVLAVGASVGAVGVGATVAVTQVDTTVEAGTGAVELSGDSLEVSAEVRKTRSHSAEAKAIGATGGVLMGANATTGNASIETDVLAQVGSGSSLQISGDALIKTRDAADAHVHATGVAAGALAVGANIANVDVTARQTAVLGGSGVVGGLLTVEAKGSNAISGSAVAGSGGLIAGHASALNVDAVSTTRARIEDNADILAGRVQVDAEHSVDYAVDSNSIQASLVGASGTFIDLGFKATTEILTGSNARLRAHDGIDLDAHSITRGRADAFSGSGGVFSGSAILIDNRIEDTSRVVLGNGTRLATIGDPLLEQPAHLTINAHNTLAVSDTGRLTVGGVIAAPYAGTEMDVDLRNEVIVGDNSQLTSSGLLRAGAYSQSTAATNAEVDIFGLAGAGGGDSEIDLNAVQKVTLGTNTDLLGYGNVALRAGQSANGIESNRIKANANTTVLNNTLIPVTAALDASAVARSFNDLTLGSGSRIRSVRNVDLLATNGELEARGKGVEKNPYLSLFSSERVEGSSATERRAKLLLNNAQIVAGVANRQEIYWDGSTLSTVSVLGDLSAAFVPAGSTNAFKPLAEIDARLAEVTATLASLTPGSEAHTQLTAELDLYTQMRLSTAQALGMGANANTSVNTLVIGDIIAGAGDIKVGADEISQSGAALTAYGAPSVIIHNSSDDYLVTDRILVSAPGSGKIVSTGAAKVASSGATLSEVGQSQSTYYDTDQRPTQPSIMIVNSYDTDLPGNNSPAPGMLVLGDIENLKGSTTLRNESGNVSQFARIESKQVTMEVPNGDLFINLPGRSWNLASVQSEWAGVISNWIPDAYTGTWGRTVPDSVAEYAANLLFNTNPDGSLKFGDSTDFSVHLLRDNGGAAGGTGSKPKLFIGFGERDYRETSADDNANWLLVEEQKISLTGNVSADDHHWLTGDTGLWHWWYPKVRSMQTRNTAALGAADTSGSSQSALTVGGSLAINAKNININAGIEVGTKTDWSLNLNGSTAAEIAGIGASTGFHQLNSVFAIADGNDASDGADALPSVYWDAANQRIQVGRIDAAGGGSVSLTGNIINTNTLGRITVNSGLGDIAINNSSGHAVLLQDMDVGGASQSVVKITDTLKTWSTGANAGGVQTWWYVNQAGQDSVSAYNNSNGASSLETAALDSTTGRSFAYNPRAGARYEWTYSYDVSRSYTGGTSVASDAGEMPGEVGAWTSNIETADGRNYLVSEGDVVVRAPTGNSQALMQWATADVDYTTATVTSGPGGWGGYGVGTEFSVATGARVEITNSVKADHAIPIRFVGQSAANIQVDSNADVLIGGEVRNSIGTTSIDVSNGGLLQAGGSLLAQHLDLNASAGIGSAGAALNLIDSRTAGASVSAASQGDIHLAVQGDLYAKRIVTPGDITIHAEGGIYQHSAAVGASIDGDVLNLHSASASTIGSASQPLVTQSNEINASAPGDILLTQAVGNMNVGFIATTFGNVELNTPLGQILSTPPKGDTFEADMLEKVALWERMGVMNPNHAQTTVNGYENLVERYYADYWSIREQAVTPDSEFRLTANGLALYAGQVGALLQRTPTEAEITSVIRNRYQEARAFLETAPGVGSTALNERVSGFNYTLDTGSQQYQNMSAGAVWEKSMLGGVINAGAEAGTRPSTGALANVSAPLGSIKLNNDPNAPLPESEELIFTIKATDGYLPVVTQTYSSEGNTYLSSQLLSFLAAAKPGTMESERISDDTVRITLKPRFDLAVESKDPVVIDAFGDYHVGTAQDVILKDITVGGTLYVYAGRDVTNQTAAGVAGAVTGGLYIDAGRNIGAPGDPIQITNDGVNPVTVYRLVAPGSANITVLNGDVVIGKIDVSGETNLIANQGNFQSLGGYAEFNSGLVNLRAVDALGNTAGHIGTAGDPFNVVLNSGSLGLFGLGANVVATSNDLSIGNSVLNGVVDLTAQAGSLRMAQAGNVIRTTDDNLGAINMVATTGIGEEDGPMELDTSRFNAETPAGDVNLHLHREASANRVHALTGSARVVADGDGQTGTMDLNIGDARIARRLDLQAETMQAAIRQTVQNTPLQITASGVGGVMSETVDLDITAAPYVLFDRLSSRLADVASNATRLNIASGHIKEQMELRTGYVSGLMDNTTPALRYNRDFQYFIPWGDFTLDMNGMGATNSRAPMWFNAARGVFTRNMASSGYAAFDLARPHFSDSKPPAAGSTESLPVIRFSALQMPVAIQPANLVTSPVSVNLNPQEDNEAQGL